jgi:hypothetical protein
VGPVVVVRVDDDWSGTGTETLLGCNKDVGGCMLLFLVLLLFFWTPANATATAVEEARGSLTEADADCSERLLLLLGKDTATMAAGFRCGIVVGLLLLLVG